jgi:hypothetical protein
VAVCERARLLDKEKDKMNASHKQSLGSVLVTLATLALFGCGGAANPTQSSATVGSAGATLTAGRVTLTIPAGALSSASQITVREMEPHHAGRAVRVEIEPRGLQLGRSANLAVQVDDSNGRVKMIADDDTSEHLAEVEVEDHGRHEYKTTLSQLGHYEVEVEHLRACTASCAANEECDDGACKPHPEDHVGAACSAVCASGLECDDGACKPHGGGGNTGGVTIPATCSAGCASGLECDDGVCKPHGGA